VAAIDAAARARRRGSADLDLDVGGVVTRSASSSSGPAEVERVLREHLDLRLDRSACPATPSQRARRLMP
jgi:hypothetical protein